MAQDMKENFDEIRTWFESGKETDFVRKNLCSTRSEFNGRLQSYLSGLSQSFDDEYLYLILSSIGEIGNNCFDHNLGYWQDGPGCLFVRDSTFCIIADRGRGVRSSLSKVYPLGPREHSYLEVAFHKVVTGRAPESRGNGLKFARKNFLDCGVNLYCVSDGETFEIEAPVTFGLKELQSPTMKNSGTLTSMIWSKNAN